LKNINNNFNEIIIGKTLSTQGTSTKKVIDGEFSSLLDNNSNKREDEKSSANLVSQQLELQNLSYLNKMFLSSVA
jgi:hypothetical protein